MLDEAPPSATGARSPRGRFRLRFSAASSSTTGTVNTLLPRYSSIAEDDRDSDLPSQNVLEVGSDNKESPLMFPPFPPRYSAIHPITLAPPPVESSRFHDDAEAVTRSNHFQYMYSVRSTKPWARLLLYSPEAVPGDPRPLQGQPKVPQIWGRELITGRIELDLDSPLAIQQINIIANGNIITSAQASHEFLDYTFNLWDGSNSGSDGKLTGIHSFPFHFPFPNAIDSESLEHSSPSDTFSPPVVKKYNLPSPTKPDSPSKGNSFFTFPLSNKLVRRVSGTQRAKKQHTLSPLDPVRRISHPLPSSVASSIPQTFIEKGITATVKYQLSVQFVHGRFKPDSRITTNICYIPASQPHPCSPKRRQAYENGALIPGPISDPDGWFDLPTASVNGIFQGSRQSKIDCKCYLAQPLSYTRGTVIPCYLILSSKDSEALASLSNPDIPNVKLIRHLRHFAMDEDEMHPFSMSRAPIIPTSQGPESILLRQTVHHEVATATWWVPRKNVPQDNHVRHLEGEIHLHPDLQPSCSSHLFHVEYYVQMLSLQSSEFEQTLPHGETAGRTVIASLAVDITTLCRLDEPLPITFTEPSKTTMRQVLFQEKSSDTALSKLLVSSGFL